MKFLLSLLIALCATPLLSATAVIGNYPVAVPTNGSYVVGLGKTGAFQNPILFPAVTPNTNNLAMSASGVLAVSGFPKFTNSQRFYSNSVREPYWGLSSTNTILSGITGSRQIQYDGNGIEMASVRHNDVVGGNSNNVIYIGNLIDWDAISLTINGPANGGPGPGNIPGPFNPRVTFVMGDDSVTWRWRETNMNDAADNNLLGHDNAGSVWIGSGAFSVWLPGSVFTGTLTTTNGLTIKGTTNVVTFQATNLPPVTPGTVSKWISVKINGESTAYRIPLYQ